MILTGDAVNIISSVGFPIFSFIVCAWFIYYSYNKSLAMYDKSLEKIGTLTQAVNNNTLVLTELVEKFGKSDNINA